MSPVRTPADHAALLRALATVLGAERVIDTHISSVMLAGDRAYKLKKPVTFGFLDFGSVERRAHFCREELRLNRRTAPGLYLGVMPVTGSIEAPQLDGTGEPIDWLLAMRRFDPEQALDRLAERGQLTEATVDALATAIAALHADAARAPAAGMLGSAPVVRRWAEDNLDELRACSHAAADRARIDALAGWSRGECTRLQPRFDQRLRDGLVRECHGDLHLANAVMVDGAPLLFDALEFNEELRWIDVVSDIAFAFMDLLDRGVPALAWRLLGGWVEASGDWDGLALLRWYAVYRALVRAKVALLRVQQPQAPRLQRLRAQVGFAHYLALAESLVRPPVPMLVVMTGLSGSGKSRVALQLAMRIGALRVRSDVERKRLAGVPFETGGAAPNLALYSAQMTQQTYARLADIAGHLLDAGLSAVIDAASLRTDERRRLARVAQSRNCAVHVVACEAPLRVLQRRIAARAQAGGDASDATLAVLAQQPGWREARSSDEPVHRIIDTDCPPEELERRCDALAAELRDATASHQLPRSR